MPDIGRAIPARAGNASSQRPWAIAWTGHPRAGGERTTTPSARGSPNGPSPRGRGTLFIFSRYKRIIRAIPARAGNARRHALDALFWPGHPRAGGERQVEANRLQSVIGPSPRGRGTLRPARRRIADERAIPARAGNAWRRTNGRPASPGHPRAGGERNSMMAVSLVSAGPSPRGRGTRRLPLRNPPRRRAIPARAGNARLFPFTHIVSPGHPRAGGERARRAFAAARSAGPSPRGRGTPVFASLILCLLRAIPARAGNARFRFTHIVSPTGHPRAGGERADHASGSPLSDGPSPRGRGTHSADRWERWIDRAIPARAGNARSPGREKDARAGHPRAGGERPRPRNALYATRGPSPRGRGTLPASHRRRRQTRAIPARAGNAPPSPRSSTISTGHPRAGGERSLGPGIRGFYVGPSPRGRGTRRQPPVLQRLDRAIPARAGNAEKQDAGVHEVSGHPRAGGERVGQGKLDSGVIRAIPARAGNARAARPRPSY